MAVLISSIILAISLGVYAISLKEVILASFLKDSARAFGAADRAVECTLYWDRSAPQNGFPYSIFSSSTLYVVPTGGGGAQPFCDNQLITDTSATGWTVTNSPVDTGLTVFSLQYPDGTCADVSVFKESNSTTTIIGNGYINCDPNNTRRTQRSIQVQGNF